MHKSSLKFNFIVVREKFNNCFAKKLIQKVNCEGTMHNFLISVDAVLFPSAITEKGAVIRTEVDLLSLLFRPFFYPQFIFSASRCIH